MGVEGTGTVGTPAASGGASSNATALPNGVEGSGSVGIPVGSGDSNVIPFSVSGNGLVGQAVANGGGAVSVTAFPGGVQGIVEIGIPVANGGASQDFALRYYWYRKAWEKKKRLELERKRKEEEQQQEQVVIEVVLDTVDPVPTAHDAARIEHVPLADPNTHPFQYVATKTPINSTEPATKEARNEVAVPKRAQNDANYTYERRPVVGLVRVAKRNIEARKSGPGSITIIQKPIAQRSNATLQVQEPAKPVWDYNKLIAFVNYMEDVA
jgi:hypothetical protein